jgi:Tfp pilus assembly pilus retraction ATPase PilT
MTPDAGDEPNAAALLRRMVEQKASDLHLKAGSPPVLRIDGEL